MKLKSLLTVAVLAVGLLVGCSGGETAEQGSATTPPAATGGTVAADVAKCAQCNKDFPKAELVSHDGHMLCKSCIASHNH